MVSFLNKILYAFLINLIKLTTSVYSTFSLCLRIRQLRIF